MQTIINSPLLKKAELEFNTAEKGGKIDEMKAAWATIVGLKSVASANGENVAPLQALTERLAERIHVIKNSPGSASAAAPSPPPPHSPSWRPAASASAPAPSAPPLASLAIPEVSLPFHAQALPPVGLVNPEAGRCAFNTALNLIASSPLLGEQILHSTPRENVLPTLLNGYYQSQIRGDAVGNVDTTLYRKAMVSLVHGNPRSHEDLGEVFTYALENAEVKHSVESEIGKLTTPLIPCLLPRDGEITLSEAFRVFANTHHVVFKEPPPVLFIQAGRFDHGDKAHTRVITPDIINIPFKQKNGDFEEVPYQFRAVGIHTGAGARGGHYVTLRKNPDGTFYLINDEVVLKWVPARGWRESKTNRILKLPELDIYGLIKNEAPYKDEVDHFYKVDVDDTLANPADLVSPEDLKERGYVYILEQQPGYQRPAPRPAAAAAAAALEAAVEAPPARRNTCKVATGVAGQVIGYTARLGLSGIVGTVRLGIRGVKWLASKKTA